MQDTLRIDLHCHSTHSDGTLSPVDIAGHCAEEDVRFAALTDHNTLDGLDSFESACASHGIGFISGLELSALHGYKDVHLLCYGFDRADNELARTLTVLKNSRTTTGHTFAGPPQPSTGEIIDIVHRAGGVVLLAHPLMTEPDPAKLEQLVDALFALGLDGLEVGYPQANAEQQRFLRAVAARHNAVVSSGTDHHALMKATGQTVGVDVLSIEWRSFRDRLVARRRASQRVSVARDAATRTARNGTGRIHMLVQIVLPALAVVCLFTLALFGYFLPHFEEAMLERKRETIQELTRTIWSMLDEANKQILAGRVTPEEARDQAAERVRSLRYGREGLDYFWLQDLSPRMIMHPYRTDLEGQDLSDFRDARGVHIFTLFADRVRQDGSGYVDYVWQWQDDPERLEAKESYIMLFEPWEWVIGTGMYIDDVNAEILSLERQIYHVMLVITGALVLLLLVIVRGGLRSERLRLSAEQRLHESNARYASLVRAAEEGVLFVHIRRCVYANPVFMELAGCDAYELPLLDWHELFPRVDPQGTVPAAGRETEIYTDSVLLRRDGSMLACRMALKGMQEDRTGTFVVLVRRAEDPGGPQNPADDTLLKRLLNLPSTAAQDIARDIGASHTDAQVIESTGRSPELVRAMLDSGASPTAVARMITSITDAATVKFIELAQAEIGPPPLEFAFVVVGSQGRQEQTLFTDQDNIIIYDSEADESSEPVVEDYFTKLAERVCGRLETAGFHVCKGQLMATNPKWRQPLGRWRERFSYWIRKAEGHETMDFMTLFDLRSVFGPDILVQELRKHIHREVADAPWFFAQAARNAVQFKTPLRLFGTIVTAGRATEKSGHLDIKAAMMPIVCYARLYALKHQLSCTGTLDRLSALCDQGFILPSRYHDILTAFETLMRLRLRHQSEAGTRGEKPDNLINVARLGHIDEAVLKECFSEIDLIQQGISWEFLGGEAGNQ